MLRIGLTRVLQAGGVRVVGSVAQPAEGVARTKAQAAGLVVVGGDAALALEVVGQVKDLSPSPLVVCLLGQVGRDDLASLLAAGCDAALTRAATPDELLDAVARVSVGERVVAPPLMPMLVMTDPSGRSKPS